MKTHLRILQLLLALLLLTTLVSAASRASFCKCTCNRNSTIIALDKTSADGDSTSGPRSCADCNRQFCLEYDLPKLADCKAENKGNEEDITAQCFQRDSAKDQAVVYTFILLTVGLLVWAGVRPYVEKKKNDGAQGGTGEQGARAGGAYAPVPANQHALG